MQSSSFWNWRLLPTHHKFTNLQCFIDSTTPLLPVSLIPKQQEEIMLEAYDGKEIEVKQQWFEFELSDFWNAYAQWSAYGAGVPLMVNGDDQTLVQYYWPSLSAMQIFTIDSSYHSTTSSTKSDVDSLSEENVSTEASSSSSTDDSSCFKIEDSTLSNQDEHPGYLYCQYNEVLSPYSRAPFLEKVKELAQEYPALMTLKSTELSSHSWVAVAWYPIYRIPSSSKARDLGACFLTYHKLSSSSLCLKTPIPVVEKAKQSRKKKTRPALVDEQVTKNNKGAIPPFGMSTYKMDEDFWFNPSTNDMEMATCYLESASSWLKQHGFQHHHDYNFFMSHAIRN